MHCRNNLVLLRGVERVQHGAGLLLRTLFHRSEQFAAARSQREMTLAPVFGRGLAADQAALFEIAQKAAEVAGVELKRPANVRCGDVIRLRDLMSTASRRASRGCRGRSCAIRQFAACKKRLKRRTAAIACWLGIARGSVN
jgi:hypothetical protein